MQVDAVTCWRVIHHRDELSWSRGVALLENLRGRQGFAHVRVDDRDIGDDIGVVHKLRPAARVAPVKGRQQGWSTVR